MQDLYLIDHFALAFRAFYAFPTNPLVNGKGEETTVVFGYGNYLFRLMAEKKVQNIAIAMDLPGPNFRHELYDLYKANRSEMPANMKAQLPMLAEFMDLLGIARISEQGYEADDVIASAAVQYQDHRVVICSKDKDLMQLVNDRVCLMYNEKKEEIIVNRDKVIDKWGVPPEQVRDLLALMGDTSDNVPGVPKIGPKTAAQLLLEYGTLDGVYENLGAITKKALKENLSNFKEQAYLSQKLVSLATELKLPAVDSYAYTGFDPVKMEEFLQKHELMSLLRPMRAAIKALGTPAKAAAPAAPTWTEAEYVLVQNSEELQALDLELSKAPLIALDTETTGLNPRISEIAGICLSTDGIKGYYLPLAHVDGPNLDLSEVQSMLQRHFAHTGKAWICHNAKFDLAMFAENGWNLPHLVYDSMIASYLLNPGAREHSLDEQVSRRLGHQMIPIEQLIGKGKSQILFSQVPPMDAFSYAAEDAVYTFRLWQILRTELEQEKLWDLYNKQELPLLHTLRQMEARGICLDRSALDELALELRTRLVELEDQIHQLAGFPFTITSPKQLGEVLFEHLSLPHGKKTKTGWSTDASVLEQLSGEHAIVPLILEFRELEKLRNTYVEVLPTLIEKKSGRVHTSYAQCVTATGRLSSNNPNLQNIPIRTSLGARIRAAFVAPESDWTLLSADYSQIELRVLAHLSGDENLIAAYHTGIDIHTQTASLLFSTFPEMVTSDMRRAAKAINFGVLYGMSAFRLSNELGIARKTAQDFIDSYFTAYPKVTAFIKNTVEQARRDGSVQTLSGLRRHLPDIQHENGNIRSGAERTAVNTPVQGTAADLIKKAMIQLEEKIVQSGLRLRLLLQVHDELVLEVHKEDLEAAKLLVKQTMEGVADLLVPLVAEVGQGPTWKDAH